MIMRPFRIQRRMLVDFLYVVIRLGFGLQAFFGSLFCFVFSRERCDATRWDCATYHVSVDAKRCGRDLC